MYAELPKACSEDSCQPFLYFLVNETSSCLCILNIAFGSLSSTRRSFAASSLMGVEISDLNPLSSLNSKIFGSSSNTDAACFRPHEMRLYLSRYNIVEFLVLC